MSKQGTTYNTTKKLHPWVIRDYRPHSTFVVVKPEYVDDIRARLVLLGYKKLGYKKGRTRNLTTGEYTIIDIRAKSRKEHIPLRALYMDNNQEWILTHKAIEDLGVW